VGLQTQTKRREGCANTKDTKRGEEMREGNESVNVEAWRKETESVSGELEEEVATNKAIKGG